MNETAPKLAEFTVFWSHPYHGSGAYVAQSLSADAAGVEAGDMIAEDLADDDADGLEVSSIRDDLDVAVWTGSHAVRPSVEPDFVLT